MSTSMNDSMNQENHRPDPSWSEPKKGGGVSIAIAVIAVLICLVLGWYTWTLWNTRQVSVQQLAQANEQNKALTSEIETRKTKHSEIQVQLATAKTELVQTKNSLAFIRSKVEKHRQF